MKFVQGIGMFFVRMVIVLILPCSTVFGQEYPVQVTTILTPPYSLYLSDYAAPDNNAFQVLIHLRELDRPSYQVKLRVTIEGQGITLRTKASYMPRPIVLQGGVPEMLTGADLSGYLNPDNMDFSGISRQQFMRRGIFPDGFYTFRIEVLDYVRNVVVSNTGLANAWMILNDPPLINLPFNGEKVVATDPQNVMFSWTPRHSASPNAAFSTEYEFTLVELYPDSRNPDDAVRASRPIFVTTTPLTSLNYSIAEPLLIPGRRYAFRVQAYDVSGRDLFKNNGYSEVHVFQFGDDCVPPTGIAADALDAGRIKLTWDELDIHTGYNVQYRKEGSTNWEAQSVLSNAMIVPGLEAGVTYEYQIAGTCGTIRGDLSPIATVTTPEVSEDAFACGAPVPEFELSTTPLSRDVVPFDVIKTADFDIVLTDVTANGDGTYRGEGRALVPWFKLASVRVTFTAIRVNEDMRVYSGNIRTIYDANSRFIASIDLKDDRVDVGGETFEHTPPQERLNIVDTVFAGVINDVSDITVVGENIVIVDATTGQQTVIPREKDDTTAAEDDYKETRITDREGNTYVVDKDGNVRRGPGTTAPDAIASRDSIDYHIRFSANARQRFGFDQKDDTGLGSYEQTSILDNDYDIPWKAVALGVQDVIDAVAFGTPRFPREVAFKTLTGPVPAQPSTQEGAKEVLVTGIAPGGVDPVTAYVVVEPSDGQPEEVEVGRVNLVTYDQVIRRLVIVPVNDADISDKTGVVNAINEIYGQAVVGLDITIADPFVVDPEMLRGLDAEESGLLSSFNQKMRDFNTVFKRNRYADKDAYYIFLIKGSGSSRAGFMPFKRQFGYVFVEHARDLATTIAHELGHGAFNLRHTFSEFPGVAQGTTQNLMDYSGGQELKKYQWDNVHDPESVIGWLEDDEEGAAWMPCFGFFDDCDDVLKKLEAIKQAYEHRNTISGKIPYSASRKVLNAKNVRIEGVDYPLISIHYMEDADTEYTLDPAASDDIDETVYSHYGGSLVQNGIAFFQDEQIIVKLLVRGDEKESVGEKRAALRMYLFGDTTSTKRENIPDDVLLVRIKTKLIEENELNTFSSFSIDNGVVTGYFIERDGVPPEDEWVRSSYKRIPANTYEVVRNDCVKFYDEQGRDRRKNCATEFRLVTTPEKSGNRAGVLIHSGTNYEDSSGCLLPVGEGYSIQREQVSIGDKLRTINVYQSNSTSRKTLLEINDYITRQETIARDAGKDLLIIIDVNR